MAKARDRISAKDRERAAKAADRARLAELRGRVRELRAAQKDARKRYRKERADLLRAMAKTLKSLPRRDRAARARKVRELARKRAAFVAWWARVTEERARRREQLRQSGAELQAWRRGSRGRIVEAKRAPRETIADAVDVLEDGQTREFEALANAKAKTERALKTEKQDQKRMRANGRARAAQVPKVTALEKRREFTGGVEANLTDELQQAVWKRARCQVLAEAKRRGVTEPDGVAEIVREFAEADEARAIEWLQQDSDAWLRAELRREGMAA